MEDSPEFEKALDLWYPVITRKRSTPRTIKRFMNHVRFLAMRLKTKDGGQDAELNEPMLVALSGIQFLDKKWIKLFHYYGPLGIAELENMISNNNEEADLLLTTINLKTAVELFQKLNYQAFTIIYPKCGAVPNW